MQLPKISRTAKQLYPLLISLRIWKSSSLFSACWRKEPDKTIEEVDPGEYDLLILPG